MMESMRNTKIVATLGPASNDKVAELVAAGVSVVRVNCSHISTEQVGETVRAVRAQSREVGILVDIQGPKLRLIDGIDATGDEVTLWERDHGDGPQVGFDPHAVGVKPGERILVNDGRIELRAVEVAPHMVRAKVERGGTAAGKRGVNLPDTDVRVRMYSDKDRADIAAAVEAGADWIALSFIQRPEDVLEARRMVPEGVRLMSKIERPQALAVLDRICEVSDGVMAARGDLGVEIAFAQLPLVQRQIADAALHAGIVAVCATEMLESMITGTRPTRAEVSDVTNAVRDGFDCGDALGRDRDRPRPDRNSDGDGRDPRRGRFGRSNQVAVRRHAPRLGRCCRRHRGLGGSVESQDDLGGHVHRAQRRAVGGVSRTVADHRGHGRPARGHTVDGALRRHTGARTSSAFHRRSHRVGCAGGEKGGSGE